METVKYTIRIVSSKETDMAICHTFQTNDQSAREVFFSPLRILETLERVIKEMKTISIDTEQNHSVILVRGTNISRSRDNIVHKLDLSTYEVVQALSQL